MFQVSLSTLLTPPVAPGAASPAALSGAFSATLAGLAPPPDGTEVGKSAPATWQAPAETGKSLPTETGESIVLPTSADDWLDPVAILASSNISTTAPRSDSAGPTVTPEADQAPKRSKSAALPIADDSYLTSGPIIISSAILSSPGKGDEPAGPKSSDRARKKTESVAPIVDPQTIIAVPPIAMLQTSAPAVTPSQGAVARKETAAPSLSVLPASTPVAATPAPLSPPAEIGAPSTTVGSDPANPVSAPAIRPATPNEPDGDVPALAATVAPTTPAIPIDTMPATTEGSAQPVAAASEAAPLPEGRHAASISLLPRKAPASAPARAQGGTVGRTAAVKTAPRGASAREQKIASHPVIVGTPDSGRTTVSRASFQPAVVPLSGGGDKLPKVATPGSTAPADNAMPLAASPSTSRQDAVGRNKADQSAAAGTAPLETLHVTAANAAPTATAIAATPPRIVTAAQPAGMLFGIALDQRPTPADRPSPRDEALQALSAIAGAGSAAPVAATGGAQHNALDMRRDDWPQAMIDRIDALRDAADATSTRITLMPDALGKVDVSLRHDGDTVHVHFAADTAQTRAMLADAQPRLADAAQARGIRLGQTSVGTGGGEAGRQPPRQPDAPMPSRPVSAAPASTDAASDSSRLA